MFKQNFTVHLLKSIYKPLLINLFLFVVLRGYTQNSDSATRSYFKTQLGYLSNSIYNGRKDSLATPYITTSIGYFNKKGFYINTTVYYLSASYASRIDNTDVELGYSFTINKKLSGSVSTNKTFYNTNSIAVNSDIKGSINSDITYDASILTLEVSDGILFSSALPDYYFTGNLSHPFNWGTDDALWSITPSLIANLSTRNSFESYLKFRQTKNGKAKRQVIDIQEIQLNNPKKLQLLSYEIAIPFNFESKKWGFFITPTYSLAQNAASITTTSTVIRVINGVRTIQHTTQKTTETIGNNFYAELGIFIKL